MAAGNASVLRGLEGEPNLPEEAFGPPSADAEEAEVVIVTAEGARERREAEERGWQVRDFRRPVRLRTRIAGAVPAPRPGVAAAVGVAAVAAILVWVALRSRVGHERRG